MLIENVVTETGADGSRKKRGLWLVESSLVFVLSGLGVQSKGVRMPRKWGRSLLKVPIMLGSAALSLMSSWHVKT